MSDRSERRRRFRFSPRYRECPERVYSEIREGFDRILVPRSVHLQ
ncbi:MAG: hypothetical protein ACQEXJ_20365 [Myxococcota bacterium]